MKTKINYKNKMQFTKKLDYTIETQKVDNNTMDCDGPIPYPTFFTQYMLINTKENFPPYIFFLFFCILSASFNYIFIILAFPKEKMKTPFANFHIWIPIINFRIKN